MDAQQENEEGAFWSKDYADWRPIPSEFARAKRTRGAIHNAINSLSTVYRKVLILRDVHIKEAAAIQGISAANVGFNPIGKSDHGEKRRPNGDH